MRKISLALLPVFLLAPSLAHAESGLGYISEILTVADSHSVLFYHAGARSNTPSCGTSNPSRWAIDSTTAHGQAVLATLLTAYSLHKQVAITGAGNCSFHSDTESVRYLYLQG